MLYIVATPIGNLSEMTFRAVEVLKSVDMIAAEDTRHTLTLLNHYGIKNKLISYQKFNERASCDFLVAALREGKNIALVSDAGMPLISDPGSVLLSCLIENDLSYTVVSGPCAAVSALVLSGLDTSAFLMLGFLPEKKIDRDTLLGKYKAVECTLIFYSAPHDLRRNLAYLYEALGDREVAVVREISKLYEEVTRGRLGAPLNVTERGEIVIVVSGKDGALEYKNLSIEEHYNKYINEGLAPNDAMKRVAKEKNLAKSIIYKALLANKD